MLLNYPGKNTMLVITLTLVCIGQWLVSIGAKAASFWIMIVGRAIFGIGSETLFALKATYTVLWFHDQEISLAMGLNSSIPFAFSFLAGELFPRWAINNKDDESMGIGTANLNGLAICLVSTIFGLSLIWLE